MMLTSSGEYGDQSRCAALGIAAYLTKPVFAIDLMTAIERALGTKPIATSALAQSRAGGFAMDGRGKPLRILLVEDNVVNQQVAAGLLTRRGHHVTLAQDGREALTRLERDTYDLVLMDLQMPVMGGLDATVAIRQRERGTGEHIRIVAMTAHAMSTDRERCLSAGMDGYLAKPIDPQLLFAAVEQGRQPPPAETLHAQTVTFDEAAFLHRLSDDQVLMADVIRVFLEALPLQLAAINKAVTEGHLDGLRGAAHALKGAAGNLSAGGLFEATRRLEDIGAESRLDAADAAWQHVLIEAAKLTERLHHHITCAQARS
jgi:two-component system sensor histidine kinase/response regulator